MRRFECCAGRAHVSERGKYGTIKGDLLLSWLQVVRDVWLLTDSFQLALQVVSDILEAFDFLLEVHDEVFHPLASMADVGFCFGCCDRCLVGCLDFGLLFVERSVEVQI